MGPSLPRSCRLLDDVDIDAEAQITQERLEEEKESLLFSHQRLAIVMNNIEPLCILRKVGGLDILNVFCLQAELISVAIPTICSAFGDFGP